MHANGGGILGDRKNLFPLDLFSGEAGLYPHQAQYWMEQESVPSRFELGQCGNMFPLVFRRFQFWNFFQFFFFLPDEKECLSINHTGRKK